MCNDRNSFITFKTLCESILIKLGGESTVVAFHCGFVYVSGFKLEAIYTPTFRASLLSISQLDRVGALPTVEVPQSAPAPKTTAPAKSVPESRL